MITPFYQKVITVEAKQLATAVAKVAKALNIRPSVLIHEIELQLKRGE